MAEDKQGTFRSRARTAGLFLAGILLIIAGLIEMVFLAPLSGRAFSSALVSMGTVLVIISGLRLWRGEKDSFQDERTRKIGAYGLSWSWFLTFVALLQFSCRTASGSGRRMRGPCPCCSSFLWASQLGRSSCTSSAGETWTERKAFPGELILCRPGCGSSGRRET